MKAIHNILIMEDDKPHHQMLNVILNSWGYATYNAVSRIEMLDAVSEGSVDLLVIDINTIQRHASDVLNQIKHIAPQIPVILMTTYSPGDMILELKKKGAADVLIKPLKLEELEATFKKAFQNRCRLPSA